MRQWKGGCHASPPPATGRSAETASPARRRCGRSWSPGLARSSWKGLPCASAHGSQNRFHSVCPGYRPRRVHRRDRTRRPAHRVPDTPRKASPAPSRGVVPAGGGDEPHGRLRDETSSQPWTGASRRSREERHGRNTRGPGSSAPTVVWASAPSPGVDRPVACRRRGSVATPREELGPDRTRAQPPARRRVLGMQVGSRAGRRDSVFEREAKSTSGGHTDHDDPAHPRRKYLRVGADAHASVPGRGGPQRRPTSCNRPGVESRPSRTRQPGKAGTTVPPRRTVTL